MVRKTKNPIQIIIQGDFKDCFHPVDDPAHAHETPGPADDLDVFDGAFDDVVGGQGDDGQIIAPGPKGRDGHHQPGQGRGQPPTRSNKGKEDDGPLRGQQDRGPKAIRR